MEFLIQEMEITVRFTFEMNPYLIKWGLINSLIFVNFSNLIYFHNFRKVEENSFITDVEIELN